MGRVYLIGAGPGDERLITLKAIDCIKAADVILYDRLINKNLLRYAREDAEVYYCGKRPGSHYKTQDQINDMLVKHASGGKTVARVKGGDPYVFGRGGEEALRLVDENIDFEVVPGITSPIAVLNYGGIPITQRGISGSFHIFTGKSSEELTINWKSVANLNGTLVFMMGLSSLEDIVENLIGEGMSEDTPSAVIMEGTNSKQKKVVGKASNIASRVREASLKSPCIIVFGGVVDLNDKLNWYEKKPLSGYNICTTRSKEQTAELKDKLLELGADVTEVYSIATKRIENSLENHIRQLEEYDYILLTSVNAVNYFFDLLRGSEFDIRNIGAKFPSIGKKTAEALRDRGIVPDFIASSYYREVLVSELDQRLEEKSKILYPKSKKSKPIKSYDFKTEGVMVESIDLYDTLIGDSSDYVDMDKVDIILFTSPSTVRNMIDLFGKDIIRKKRVFSIGPLTQRELESQGIGSIESRIHDTDGIIDTVLEKLK